MGIVNGVSGPLFDFIYKSISEATGFKVSEVWRTHTDENKRMTSARIFDHEGKPYNFSFGEHLFEQDVITRADEIRNFFVSEVKKHVKPQLNPQVICVDFDGTCVTHEFPKIGKDIGAAPVLKALVEQGHKLVLFTMRSDVVNPESEDNDIHLASGDYLTQAVQWFKQNEIELYGIQTNPTQSSWTSSPKAYGQLYIDDAALGIPLRNSAVILTRPFVDWKQTEALLREKGYLPFVPNQNL